jgi:hypothetical protein
MDGWYNHNNKIIFINTIILFFSASYSTHSIWWHYRIITVPKVLKHPNIAFLMIEDGHYFDK